MDRKLTDTEAAADAKLAELLSSLRMDPAPEADFESRFLHDLRDRMMSESVCRPARYVFFEHLMQKFENLFGHRWIIGTSSAGVCALAAAYWIWPSATDQALPTPAAQQIAQAYTSPEQIATTLQPGASDGVCRLYVMDRSAQEPMTLCSSEQGLDFSLDSSLEPVIEPYGDFENSSDSSFNELRFY